MDGVGILVGSEAVGGGLMPVCWLLPRAACRAALCCIGEATAEGEVLPLLFHQRKSTASVAADVLACDSDPVQLAATCM